MKTPPVKIVGSSLIVTRVAEVTASQDSDSFAVVLAHAITAQERSALYEATARHVPRKERRKSPARASDSPIPDADEAVTRPDLGLLLREKSVLIGKA